MRIGHGYDTHRFAAGRPLVLGGVAIPYDQGLSAYSDGDVVIHALCDALLGAAALGDLGTHFPDDDSDFKDIDSRNLLRKTQTLLGDQGWKLINADITIIAEAPKLAPHIDAMRANLSTDLGVHQEAVSIKATTNEKMDAIGQKQGIAVHAVALIN